MSEFLPPRMHEAASDHGEEEQARPHEAPPAPAVVVAAPTPSPHGAPHRRPGALGRLIALIVTVGLAWALTVAITAWLLGLFLARG